jgi:hypothetical protein
LEEYEDVEVEVHNGGQKHYPLFISLEWLSSNYGGYWNCLYKT